MTTIRAWGKSTYRAFLSLSYWSPLSICLSYSYSTCALFINIYIYIPLFVFPSRICISSIKNTDYCLKYRRPTTKVVLYCIVMSILWVSKNIWPEYIYTPYIIHKTVISRKRTNVWENGGTEQYIKSLVIFLTVLAYITSLWGRKPFIFIAGFIKTPRAKEGGSGGGGQNFFPLHKTRL